MATLGKLHEFQPDTEELAAYLERVDIYFAANDVNDEKKVPVLLSAIGGNTYGILRSLLAPESPMSKTYGEITAKLREHFEPKVNVIAERFLFHKRDQHSEETVTEYVAELRRLATRCSFDAYLNDALRDRLVCGLKSESIQKSLLAEKGLTLAPAVDKAKEMEAAHKSAQTLKKSLSLTVGRTEVAPKAASGSVRPLSTGVGGKVCYRCGNVGHSGKNCMFRGAICYKCKKKGHLAKVCRGRMGPGAARESTKWVEVASPPAEFCTDNDATNDLLCNVNTVGAGKVNPYKVVLELDSTPVTMEIDTGAAVHVLDFPGNAG